MPRILLVEDDDDLRFVYETALARQGHVVVAVVRTPAEALLRLANQDFDAVVLDPGASDLSGMKVVEFARQDVRLRDVPFILVAADGRWRPRAHALGVPHFLIKPVPLRVLLDRLDEVLAG